MTFDPLVEERMSPTVSVPRHPATGNPFIVPRDGSDAVEYTRASGLSEYLVKNIFHLAQWEKRYLAPAIARNPDLAAEAAVQHYSTGPITGTQPISARKAAAAALDDIIARALERAGIHEAANCGTAVHKATEPGAPDSSLAGPMAYAVREYHTLTAALERVASEVFIANDEVRVAGTFDSAYISPEFPGCIVVGDTKTGKGYHQAEFEIQLASYARGEVYLGPPIQETVVEFGNGISMGGPVHQRIPFTDYFGLPVNLKVGYLVHVPLLGSPKPRIVKLDLERGWRLAQSAARTRDDRDELDKIGIGEKVDHRKLAADELERLYEELLIKFKFDPLDPDGLTWRDEFRARGQALYRRFAPHWTDGMTAEIKARLS